MKTTISKFLLGCTLALGGLTASAQGLEGIIVEEFHTVSQADADFINNDLGNSSFPIVAGSKVYRVYVDMAPNYKLLTVGGSAPDDGNGVHPLDFSTTTTFWNDDNFGSEFPVQTRRASTGTLFDSYITFGSTGTAGGASPCGALGSNLAQLGILRTADTNGDLTSCGVFPSFTGNDGSIPGTVPALTTNLSGLIDFTALTGSASSFVIGGNTGDSYATLPANTGVDPANTNLVLIGQFTTDGVFSFNINVVIQSPTGENEFYVWSNPIQTEVVSPFLTYPQAQVNDCAGVPGGTAAIDACGVCAGGTTGIVPDASCTDCAGVVNGTAAVDACGVCAGGNTGIVPDASCTDCAGVVNGTAAVDACGVCAGGTTGIVPDASCTDCAGVVNGTAAVDACGVCAGGNTGIVPDASCTDCAGVVNGTAAVDACGVCAGGNTGIVPDAPCTDCAGVVNGTAAVDACGVCAGGNTGITPDASCTDCLGVVNGTAVVGTACDDLNALTENDIWLTGCVCQGTPVGVDCAGVPNGTAAIDACGVCAGGTTGLVPDASCTDCAGVVNGTAAVDACGVCAGGTTGLIPDASCTDCAGVVNGTAAVDACGVCAGGTTGLVPDASCTDCLGVVNGTAVVGTACNDLNASTVNDIWLTGCVCAGTPVGTLDCEGVLDGPAVPGSPCDDGNSGTGNDVYGVDCVCAGLPLDCAGTPGGTALPGTPCDDGLATTGSDVYGVDCMCAGQLIDCLGVVGGTALPGTSCNDGLATTINDAYDTNCLCVGTPIGNCTEIVTIEIETDGQPAQTSWEIIPQGGGAALCTGAGSYPANSNVSENCCLAQGCYALRVLDSAGDGISNGGYILREEASGLRIIDNSNNFSTGSVSAVNAAQGFCLPLGTGRLIDSSCDKEDWAPNRFVVASADAAVSAQFGVSNATSGYVFWFFDPNGTYSYRRFRSHATSDGYGSGATRACHFQINGWVNTPTTPHIPANVLLNVRVRNRVAGVNQEFGPACRFQLDPARAACPLIKLQDAAGSKFSCGVTRNFGNGNTIYATPPQFIPAVNASLLRYQFRFRNESLGYEVIRERNTYVMPLYWTDAPALECGVTYSVDVRVSKDNGATWCIDTPAPAVPYAPWGEVCTVTIAPCSGATLAPQSTSNIASGEARLTMYPNPNRGDQVFISLSEVGADVRTVTMDIFDMTGKRVAARSIAVQDGFLNSVVELNGDLSGGLYMVNITAGDKTYTERLVVQP